MKLSNLALDDAGRKEAQAQIEALDKKESEESGAMRTRDQQTLTQYQDQLRAQIRGDLDKQLASVHSRTQAKLGAPGSAIGNLGAPSQVAINAGKGPGAQAAPADLQTKLQALHRQYQDQFNADAKQTIADFTKTREDLQRRFDQLRGADSSAQSSAQAQLVSLQKQHDDLYAEIVAQIQREVQSLAKSRGISVVVSDVVAPGGSVDLTQDAQKQIESLHE
jgi:Skp family chaperone for outer membrane proteins